MAHDEPKLSAALEKRQEKGNLRSLKISESNLIDFSSNDYLGLAQNQALKTLVIERYEKDTFKNGSTGSRLLTGNSALIERTEAELSSLFSAERALLFGSGYLANLAFFSSIPQRNDVILYDELSHASIKDGCRLSMAKKISFRHNDLPHLREKLEQVSKSANVFVAVESVYSMDGDFTPLEELVALCDIFSAKLVVDEAHSTGIWGANGSGLLKELNLEDKVYARIMTFGKAMGTHGACVCGSDVLINYLINFARPFIYTTAPGPFEVIAIQTAFAFLADHPALSADLKRNIQLFTTQLQLSETHIINSESPIQAIKIPGNSNAQQLSNLLQTEGFDARAILSPTVAAGSERLRICLHAFNSKSDIVNLCALLNSYFQN